jgi:hypothetical protein
MPKTWGSSQRQARLCRDKLLPISLDNPWLFFNVEQLSDDPRLETAMSLLIAHATAQRAAGKAGRRSITVLDECWFLLDSPVLAPEVVQLFRTARKRNASVGNEPNSGRFCGDGIEAQAARSGHRKEFDDQNHWPAAR